jgi:hypothetical protein
MVINYYHQKIDKIGDFGDDLWRFSIFSFEAGSVERDNFFFPFRSCLLVGL